MGINERLTRIREKTKAIWHIFFDAEYIVCTVTIRDNKRVASCCLISDNISRPTVHAACKFLESEKDRLKNEDEGT